MANLDVIANNLGALRIQVGELVANQDAQEAAQAENQNQLQMAIQQRGPHPEVASFRPPTFKCSNASEDADRWLKRFTSYADYCNMDNQKKSRAFRLMVDCAAEVWLNGLADAVKQDCDQLRAAFTEKYINANNITCLKEQGLLARIQGPQEPVEGYITDVR